MSPNNVIVGTDVDDVRYHGSALNPSTGEMKKGDRVTLVDGSMKGLSAIVQANTG
jgi:hypothetical protein